MAYYQLEPFGSPVEDERFRTLAHVCYAPHMRSGATMPNFFDRDPKPKEAEDDIITFFLDYGTVEDTPAQ